MTCQDTPKHSTLQDPGQGLATQRKSWRPPSPWGLLSSPEVGERADRAEDVLGTEGHGGHQSLHRSPPVCASRSPPLSQTDPQTPHMCLNRSQAQQLGRAPPLHPTGLCWASAPHCQISLAGMWTPPPHKVTCQASNQPRQSQSQDGHWGSHRTLTRSPGEADSTGTCGVCGRSGVQAP